VLLAYDPDAATHALSLPLRGFTPRTITDPAALAAELDRIRRAGIAFEDEESQLGLSCVAAPVRHRAAGAIAALSVTGPRGRIDIRRLSAELRRVAAAASLAIGRMSVARVG
jgi:IclR family transcriptional regulator, KDG regulon repressor